MCGSGIILALTAVFLLIIPCQNVLFVMLMVVIRFYVASIGVHLSTWFAMLTVVSIFFLQKSQILQTDALIFLSRLSFELHYVCLLQHSH